MTIRDSIKQALKSGPKTIPQLAKVTGHDEKSINNAKHYMNAEGYIRVVKGKPGMYELMPLPELNHGNVLKSPVWVPPKPLHRPTYEAPGMIVREKLTGMVLHG